MVALDLGHGERWCEVRLYCDAGSATSLSTEVRFMCAWVDDHIVALPSGDKAAIAKLEGVDGVTVVRELSTGTTTRVYLVDVKTSSSRGVEGSWVVKVDTTCRARREVGHHATVIASALGKYVPVLQDKAIGDADDDLSVLLYSLARGSFLNNQTLQQAVENRTQRPAQMIGRIAKALVGEWNAVCEHSTTKICQILRDSLAESRVHRANIEEHLEGLLDVTARRIEGEPLGDQWLLNPVPYILGSTRDLEPQVCTVPLGHVHGDLHPGNLVVSAVARVSDAAEPPFTIIDFALYRPRGNILFDLAYLEIALVWYKFEGFQSHVDRSSWWALEKHLVSDLVPTSRFDGVGKANDAMALILGLRNAVRGQAQKVHRVDDYWIAYLAASVEASLILAGHPGRIEKDARKQPHLKLAASLMAASRFHCLVQKLDITEELRIREEEGAPGRVTWPETAVSRTTLKSPDLLAKFDSLAHDLMPPLRGQRCMLIVGDQFSKEVLGIPLDGALMRQVADRLEVETPLRGGGEANVAALDWIDADYSDKQRAVADYLGSLDMADAADKCKNLGLIRWSAILDWSFSPVLRDLVASWTPVSSPVRRIFCDESPDTDFHSPGFMPFLHLRGSTDEFRRLALGIAGLREQRETRRKVLRRLLEALPYKSVLLFVGFERSTFDDHVQPDISEVVGPSSNVWVVRSRFTYEHRMIQEKSRGYKVAELSPSEFLEFCGYVGRAAPAEIGAEEGCVLDIRGVEKVKDEAGRAHFRRSEDEGHTEEVRVRAEDFRKIGRHLEVLHRNALAVEDDSSRVPGDFYRGHVILWKELAQELDVWPRRPAGERMMKSILRDLGDAEPRRISLWYQPGAGGTTMLRRVGFSLYFDHQIPVVLLRRYTRDTYGEVVRFYTCFSRSFVLLADEQDVSRGDSDLLYGQLQERRVPVVLIYAARSGQPKLQLKRAKEVRRRFYLVDELDASERSQLGQKLEPHLSGDQLKRFRRCKHESLFLTLIETFETDFAKIEDVVHGILESADDLTAAAITRVCFFWYYGHRWTPSGVLEKISEATPEALTACLETFEERLLWSEHRQGEKVWFPRHDLLAHAVLALTIGSSRPAGTRLKNFAIDLIKELSGEVEAADVYQMMVWALIGTDREQALQEELKMGLTGTRTLPSRLMKDIGSISGQDDVWQTVTSEFPDVPLFLGHYGRFLYGREVKQYERAESFLLKANELSKGTDHTILHMLGMRFRSELNDKLRERRDTIDAKTRRMLSERMQFLAEQAAHYFEQATRIEPQDEHGYVSYIQMLCGLVVDALDEAQRGGKERRTALLSEDVQEWLRKAHDLIQAVEIYVSLQSRSEYFRKAKHRVCSSRLEGRNVDDVITFYRSALGTSPSGQHGLIRESLARSLSQRASDRRMEGAPQDLWRLDFDEAADCLSAELQQDPYNTRKIALWFRCARFSSHVSRRDLIERLEDLWREAETLEVAFYLGCLYFLEGLQYSNISNFERSEKFRGHSEALAPSRLTKRTIREWAGSGYALIPRAFVVRPEEYRAGEDPRKEFTGIVSRVQSEQEGKITIEKTAGCKIWFPPNRPGRYYFSSADVGQPVHFLVGFSYDKPRAWLTKS